MKGRPENFSIVGSLFAVLAISAPLAGGTVDPQALAILQQLSEHLQKSRTYRVDIHISTTEEHQGCNLSLVTDHELALSKPDKIAFVTKHGAFGTTILFQGCNEIYVPIPALKLRGFDISGAEMGVTLISNGTQMYVNTPYVVDMPKSETSAIIDVREGTDLRDLFSRYDIAPYCGHGACASHIISELFLSNVFDEERRGNTVQLQYLGRAEVHGVECDKVKYCFPTNNEWYLFIQATRVRLLTEVRSEFSHKDGDLAVRLRQSTVFRNWRIDQSIPPDQFKVPPQDAQAGEGIGGPHPGERGGG